MTPSEAIAQGALPPAQPNVIAARAEPKVAPAPTLAKRSVFQWVSWDRIALAAALTLIGCLVLLEIIRIAKTG